MSIYYVAPDLARPSGGVRTIYRHVDVLNELGLGAAVVHARRGFRCAWFENSTRVVYPPLILSSSDVLVLPEQYASAIPRLVPGIRKVIFNQNAYRTFDVGGDVAVRAYSTTHDVIGAMVVSEDSAQYLRHCFPDLRIGHVRHTIDPNVFRPEPRARTTQIAAVPAKRPHELRQVLDILRARRVLEGWHVVTIERMNEADVAATLQASALFVSLNKADGFGLPPAEAIACGCKVVGFHGMGAREYFKEPYVTPIEDGDLVALASAIEGFVRTYPARQIDVGRRGDEGATWITRRYSRERQAGDLEHFFEMLPDLAGAPTVLHAKDFPRPSIPDTVKRVVLSVARRVTRLRPPLGA